MALADLGFVGFSDSAHIGELVETTPAASKFWKNVSDVRCIRI